MRSASHEAQSTLYIPAGWLLAEASAKGVLLYGARVTLAVRSERSYANYEALIGFFNAAGKPAANMEQTLPVLAADKE